MFNRATNGATIGFGSSGDLPSGRVRFDPATDEIVFGGAGWMFALDINDWTFAGDFMVELPGVKFVNNTAVHRLISQWRSASGQRSWLFHFDGSTSPKKLQVFLSGDGTASTTIEAEFSPTVNTPYDIAFNRNGSSVRIFAGAAGSVLPMIGSGTFAGALNNSAHQLLIGALGGTTADSIASGPLNGRMAGIPRITHHHRGGDDDGYQLPTLPWPTQAS